jgi:hypothetical protein
MKHLRQAILWTVLAAIGLVAVLSVIGAFLGAEKAKALFNSAPLIFFWFLWLTMLAAGFLFFRRLAATHAGLAMHLGALLVVAGAMWGSDKAHTLRAERWGSQKVPSGFMVLYQGEADDRVLDDRKQWLATLPQQLRLNDFRIDYYPDKDHPWGLVVVATQVDPETRAGRERWGPVPWTVGETTPIPYTRVRLTALQYLDHARPAPGGGAVADPASPSPAMEVLLECQDRRQRAWLVPEPGRQAVRFHLDPLLCGEAASEDDAEGPDLYFGAPVGPIKAYLTDVAVLENDRPVADIPIEVNRPMHWGGYHFYQHDYDKTDESYTILRVVSDSGLWAVYLGLALLVAGTFGRCWLEPAGEYLGIGKRRKDAR